ncbi:MAG: type II toxin-antitoxin system VapC family toxin [Rickettsiaceae bacterium]|nr:type II toxin-antitoxin system VapC family toxin [Rickettsiaceae bacterium]
MQKKIIPKNKKLLDTSAVISILQKESGYKLVEEIIASSAISAVNFSELVAVLARSSIPEKDIDKIITDIVPEIIPFSEDIAINAGKLVNKTKEYGLSLGDRACLATGQYYGMEIYTADKAWLKLQKHIKSNIIIIR